VLEPNWVATLVLPPDGGARQPVLSARFGLEASSRVHIGRGKLAPPCVTPPCVILVSLGPLHRVSSARRRFPLSEPHVHTCLF
jgi:hypothetical protein